MNTEPELAHGSRIFLGDGADPEVFAAIGHLGDFSYGNSIDLIDTTSHDSGGRKEYTADILDADEVTFQVQYIAADPTHTTLIANQGDRANFRIEAPNEPTGVQIRAVIQNVSRTYPVMGAVKAMDVTLKPIGATAPYAVT